MIPIKENIQKIQPYVPGVLKAGAIKLASNENPLGASPKAVQALKNMVSSISLYPDGGAVLLKQKLAQHYNLQPENFIIGNGSDEVFIFAAGAVIGAGDEVLTSTCTFSEYAFSAKLFGGTPVFVPMQAGTYQLQDFVKAITPKTKLICIANPNNPTGTYVPETELVAFLKQVPKKIIVLIDEAYCEYVNVPDYPDALSLLKEFPNLLITRTFSKIYGLAGLRVGYMIGDASLLNELNKAREPFNVNMLAQAAAVAALDDVQFVAKSIKNNETGKAYLEKEFQSLGLKWFPTVANFIFVYLPIDCTVAFDKLMDLGVTVRPMKGFGEPKAIRVTIGTPKQNQFFIKVLKKVLGNK